MHQLPARTMAPLLQSLSDDPKRNSRRDASKKVFLLVEDERFHGLPPLRRFKILEKERQESLHQQEKRGFEPNVRCLPAKKRVCALKVFTVAEEEKENVRAQVVPAKKRVCALKVFNVAEEEKANTKAQIVPAKKRVCALKVFTVTEEEKENTKAQVVPGRRLVAGKKEPPPRVLQSVTNQQISRETGCMKELYATEKRIGHWSENCLDKGQEINQATRCVKDLYAKEKKIGHWSENCLDKGEEISRETRCVKDLHAKEKKIGHWLENCLDKGQEISRETRCVKDLYAKEKKIGHWPENCLDKGQELRENATTNLPLVACAEATASDEDEDDGICCSICKGSDADSSDPIVFCDGCNVMVHASCYGYPLINGIPSGDWFCCQCISGDAKGSKRCCLCPSTKGAMKRTTNGLWAHLSCALFVPEVYYTRAREREGIECGSVPSWRWRMPCGLCGLSGSGACIQCTEVNCCATFHVSCALDRGLPIDYRHANVLTRTPAIVIAFCPLHSPRHRTLSHADKRRFKIVPRN